MKFVDMSCGSSLQERGEAVQHTLETLSTAVEDNSFSWLSFAGEGTVRLVTDGGGTDISVV